MYFWIQVNNWTTLLKQLENRYDKKFIAPAKQTETKKFHKLNE